VLSRTPDPAFSRDLTVGGLERFLERGWLPEGEPVAPLDAATARVRLQVDLREALLSRGFELRSGVRALLEDEPGGCVRVRPVGEQPQVVAAARGSSSALRVLPDASGPLGVRLLTADGPSGSRDLALEAGVERSLLVALSGELLLTLPEDGTTLLCP
jgi:hypothetical protein